MKRIYNWMIDYEGRGKRDFTARVEMTLKETEKGPVFSAHADISRRGKMYAFGQCLDEIAKYINDPTYKTILRLWKLYHLNDMHPECKHQREAGWTEQAKEEITLYHYILKQETRRAQFDAEQEAKNALKRGETFTPTPEQVKLVNLPTYLDSYKELSGPNAEYYELHERAFSHPAKEKKARGWVRIDEDERGILCKPCPVCGHEYGRGWNYMPIPADDLALIYDLMKPEAGEN